MALATMGRAGLYRCLTPRHPGLTIGGDVVVYIHLFGKTSAPAWVGKEIGVDYETWESLADEIEITTGEAACWTCFLDDSG
jgi:hypothetical protein